MLEKEIAEVQMKKISCFLLICMFGCTAPKDTRDHDSVQYVHKYGTPITYNEWYEYGQSGKIMTHLENGILMVENFENGILHGDKTYSYPHDSVIEKKEVYEKGKLLKVIYYHPSNLPMSQVEFLGKNMIKETKWSKFGFPHLIETYNKGYLVEGEYFCSKGNLIAKVSNGSGVKFDRDFDGTLLKKDIIEKGNVVLSIEFYEDYFPKTITSFDRNEIHGVQKRFLPKGEPASEEAYYYGQLHGMCVKYEEGQVISTANFKKGKKSGIERIFTLDGDLIQDIQWENGIKHGPSTHYENGNESVEWYFEGEPSTQLFFEQKQIIK